MSIPRYGSFLVLKGIAKVQPDHISRHLLSLALHDTSLLRRLLPRQVISTQSSSVSAMTPTTNASMDVEDLEREKTEDATLISQQEATARSSSPYHDVLLPISKPSFESNSFSFWDWRNETEKRLSDETIQLLKPYFEDDRKNLTTTDFRKISQLLESENDDWSQNPRLFWLYCKVGRLNLMGDFDQDDYEIPVKPPPDLTNYERHIFDANQATLLSKHWTYGDHHFLASRRELPWRCIGNSQDEGYLTLDRETDGRAHTVLSKRWQHKDSVRVETMLAQIRSLVTTNHLHLPEYFGSFSTPHFIGIISPLMFDYNNLDSYLRRETPSEETIQSWFGCLASAVAHLHSQNLP